MKKLIVAVFLMVISAAGIAAQVQIPPIARVVDTSGTLTQAQISSLTARGNELEKATGTVVVSLIVPTTGDESIDDFSMRVAETWHPGKAGVDRAAVLVIAKNDKKWAIKTSRNTGVTLTDVRTKVTLNKMGAYLKDHKGDFAGAIGVFYSEIEPYIKADTLSPAPTPVATAEQDSSWSTMLWVFGVFGAVGAAIVIGIWWKVQREKAEAERLRLEREAELEAEREYREMLRRSENEARRAAQAAAAVTVAAANPWPRKSYKQPVSTVEPTKKRVVERVRDTTIVPVVTTVPTYSSRRDDDDDYSRRSSSYSSRSSSDSYSSWDSSSSSSSSSSFDGGGSSSSFD